MIFGLLSHCVGRRLAAPVLLFVVGGDRQASAQTNESVETRTVHATRIDGQMTVDGRLDESAWQVAIPTGSFVQREPHEGQAATERTEVRVLYNELFLYIGATCYDSDPAGIRVAELSEDHSMSQEDSFSVIIDSFGDKQTNVQFETNPEGSRSDVQHSGNGTSRNADWDTIWYVRTSRRPDGWVVEIAIPFRSLRFAAIAEPRWGINFRRRIRRKFEENVWNRVPRSESFTTPSTAGTLVGLSDIRPGRNLYFKPFAVGALNGYRDKPGEMASDGGIDVKYGVTSGLTLDATYRTDFAQAEVDQQQVNLTRFSLFFPEKREFFLENSGVFTFAEQSSSSNSNVGLTRNVGNPRRSQAFGQNDFVLFFSRRVGLSPTGTPVPVVGGARLTGRLPGRVDVGLLNISTGSGSSGFRGQNFSVAKLRKIVLGNSDVGAMVINREDAGATFNRIVGVEQNLRLLGTVLSVNSFWAKTFSPGASGRDGAWGVSTNWRDRAKGAGIFFREIEEDFNNEVGFVRRSGIRQVHGNGGLFIRPRRSGLARVVREVAPRIDVDYVMSGANQLLTRTVTPAVELQFQDASNAIVTWEGSFDRVDREFLIGPGVPIPAGDYTNDELRLEYLGDDSRGVSGTASMTRGSFYGGTRTGFGVGPLIKPTSHVGVRLEYTRNAIELRTRRFASHLATVFAAIGFTPDVSLNVNVQYNSDTRQSLTNLRFRYNYRPWNDFFVVYRETADLFAGGKRDRALIAKLTYVLGL
jgi:hypothetical protein